MRYTNPEDRTNAMTFMTFAGAGVLLLALGTGGFTWALPRLKTITALALQPRTSPAVNPEINETLQLQVQASTGRDSQALETLNTRAKAGHVMAQRALGLVLLDSADPKVAEAGLNWLNEAATHGDNTARVRLGRLYLEGSTLVTRDYARSLQWFNAAGLDKDPAAAYFLGVQYTNGYGVAIDAKQAAIWYALSAEQGQPAALFMLANAYQYGKGVAPNFSKAVELYSTAAELEHPQAIQTLAMAYSHGEMGLPVDSEKSMHYMAELAHALKHPPLVP